MWLLTLGVGREKWRPHFALGGLGGGGGGRRVAGHFNQKEQISQICIQVRGTPPSPVTTTKSEFLSLSISIPLLSYCTNNMSIYSSLLKNSCNVPEMSRPRLAVSIVSIIVYCLYQLVEQSISTCSTRYKVYGKCLYVTYRFALVLSQCQCMCRLLIDLCTIVMVVSWLLAWFFAS